MKALEAIKNPNCSWRYNTHPDDFIKVPGAPISYWISDSIRNSFATMPSLGEYITSSNGIQTGNNDLYTRYWHEVDSQKIGIRWFPYAKGGQYRKWFGNLIHVVEWENRGSRIKAEPNCCVRGERFYFRHGITWSDITSARLSFRYLPSGSLFDAEGPTAFVDDEDQLFLILALLNTELVHVYSKILNPTLSFQSGDFRKIPVSPKLDLAMLSRLARKAVHLAQIDWNTSEISSNFQGYPLVLQSRTSEKVVDTFENWSHECSKRTSALFTIEEQINSTVNRAYSFVPDANQHVLEDQITIYRPDREEDIKRLISYAIGCMMGRYSLDKPGLIYAHSGNKGFDLSQYQTFPADDDGIIPMMETDWFPDDASNRLIEFISGAWPKEHLEENLTFIADSLGPNRNEQPRDTIRRYFATGFYKHHLSMYKRRPIYWLFSSGKQRAFQCLVYLHRYHEGTLSRMRTEYVIPLQGKMASRLDQLADDIAVASSTSHRKKLEKDRDKLRKQHTELQAFDEQLRHYADRRISLDLDDGVKINYEKFGDLLADVKAVTGGSEEP